MPAIVIAIISALAMAMRVLVVRVLSALGIQYVTYKGLEMYLDQVVSALESSLASLPAQIIGYVGLFKIPTAVSIIIGAIAAKWTVMGVYNGAITKMVIK